MTKYYYSCDNDKKLIEKSFNNIAFLLFGKNNKVSIEAIREYFETKVSQVNIYPQGTTTKYVNDKYPGICRLDENEKIIIEMLGYKGAKKDKYSWIKHEGTHEFAHAFIHLLSQIMSKNPQGIIKNGVLYKNHMGMIKESDAVTGKPVGQHYYGKMYNETMMDIISSMAINCFDSITSSTSVDDILNSNYNSWGNEITGYSLFTSITRLTIAAFSNNGFINYQNAVDAGLKIFNGTTKMQNGEIYMINDFLYGIVYDPLHIEKEFDKIEGEGNYRILCEYLDRLFLTYLDEQKLPEDQVKLVMDTLPDFLNKKLNYYQKNGIINNEGASKIISNFNRIWNAMQTEYGAYFSGEEISDIARRSGRI